ncbi:MAG: c-type cytochrome [Acidobacteriaceae bacterium]|jgi:Photosynthetic reaction centre cytochrome C subunit
MQSRLLFAGVFLLALAAQPGMAASTAQEAGGPPAAESHRPLPKPVNLKVLPKNITPEELREIMRGFAGSLGVKCGFCHAMNPQTHKLDFPSDAKQEKTTARLMIRMTRTVNADYMVKVNDPDATPADKHVTCGTCHRGHHMPEHFVPPPDEHDQHPTPPAGGPAAQ